MQYIIGGIIILFIGFSIGYWCRGHDDKIRKENETKSSRMFRDHFENIEPKLQTEKPLCQLCGGTGKTYDMSYGNTVPCPGCSSFWRK